MGKKTKSTASSVAAPVAPVPTASTKKKSAPPVSAPQAVRHRGMRRKNKLYMVSKGQAKRLALRAGEPNISLKAGVPQFLTVQVHHLARILGSSARSIADTRKKDSTIRASDLQEAIRTQFHFRVYNTSAMLSDEKHARRIRAKRLAREREQNEKKKLEAADAATSEAAGA